MRQKTSPPKPCWKNPFVFDLPIIDRIGLFARSARYRIYVHVASSYVHSARLCSCSDKRSAFENGKD